MSSHTRPAQLFLCALAVLEVLVSVSPVVATPIPLPLPLMMADYSPSVIIHVDRSISHSVLRRDADLLPSASPVLSRAVQYLTYYDGAVASANDLQNLAAQSSTVDEDDFDFQKACVDALNGFNTNMDGFKTLLADDAATSSTSDKGLGKYDKQNDLETMLKNLVNVNKDTLSATTVMVYNIPGLGPVLGPYVYNLKCLLDEILDAVEDYLDATITQLGPALRALLGQANTTTCKLGVVVAGLCI